MSEGIPVEVRKPGRLITADDARTQAVTHSHPWNANSEMTGVQFGRLAKLERAGVNLARLVPGRESFVYHAHDLRIGIAVHYFWDRHAGDGRDRSSGEAGDFAGFPAPPVPIS